MMVRALASLQPPAPGLPGDPQQPASELRGPGFTHGRGEALALHASGIQTGKFLCVCGSELPVWAGMQAEGGSCKVSE